VKPGVRVRSSHIQRRALREMACLADDVLVVVVEARHPRQRLETRGQQSQVAVRAAARGAGAISYRLAGFWGMLGAQPGCCSPCPWTKCRRCPLSRVLAGERCSKPER
jgi:hypothetical protein